MKPKRTPRNKGLRRWRTCSNRGCERGYYGHLDTCPTCRAPGWKVAAPVRRSA